MEITRLALSAAFSASLLAGCVGAQLDDGDSDEGQQALSSDCSTTRPVVCHDSPNNCSYAAKECDPLPRALDRVSLTPLFPLNGTGHLIEDSLGNPLGHTLSDETSVHINWGQRRTLHGNSKVLVWSVRTDGGTISGWINESAINRNLSWMPSATAPDPGGSYSTWHVVASDNSPYLDHLGHSLKVVQSCASGLNATDYLGRNGRYNLIYNLPGYENPPLGSGTIDTYFQNAGLHFLRAQAQASLDRPLFDCSSGSPVATGKTLRFLYGYIEGSASRHGWIAMPNIAPGT